MRMRLLMSADAVGGVWSYAIDLARALDADVTLAVLGPAPDAGQAAEAAAVPNLRLVETGLPLDWLSDGPAPVLIAAEALAAMARETRADLVHLNSPTLAVGGFGVPVVAVNHGCLGTWWQAVRGTPVPEALAWLPEMTARGLAAADRTVAPTRAYAEATARRYGLAAVPAAVYNGRTEATLASAEPFDGALTIGRLWDEAKDVATLDAAAALLPVPVVAIGATRAPHGAEVVPGNLQLTGALPGAALAGWFARRPVFVSTARFEPFGLAVLEAAQAGCPLVLADLPSFRELWDGAARFVAPGDATGFATAIAAALAERDAAGAAARSRAAAYTPAAMAAGMGAIYRDLLARGSRAA